MGQGEGTEDVPDIDRVGGPVVCPAVRRVECLFALVDDPASDGYADRSVAVSDSWRSRRQAARNLSPPAQPDSRLTES
jgi:hypothetical protein